jgi:putative transposase
MTRRKGRISGEVLDELLGGEDPGEALRSGELLAELQKRLAERALHAEMEAHLGSEEEAGSGNHRNGHNRKRVLTGTGSVELSVPRDRAGRFEPQLIEKWVRRLPGFDEKVISLYARGLTTREIRAHVEELYGVTVSRELISKVTDEVHEELREWRSRPLEAVYPIVYFDALRVKVREEGLVQNKAVHLAIGVTVLGQKEILGLWTASQEGAKFWLRVMNELKARGVRDVLIVVVDGLKGFPEAVEAAFPEATVQTCLVHLIRYSLAHASWKERKELASVLRPIYQAETLSGAEEALDAFEASSWGRKFPAIVRSWRRNWTQVIPFFAFSKPIRRMIYTTNAIESLNSTVRRAVRTRGHFPNDRAAMKLIYLTLRKVERKWERAPMFWFQARAEFAIQFGDRFPMEPL